MLSNQSLSFACKHVLHILVVTVVYIWSFFEGVLFVGGFILCIMLPVVWPMKFVYAVLWLVVFYVCTKVVFFLENHVNRDKNSE